MADNTPQNGTATVATDEVATLNGAASSGVHVQRMKGGWGADGDYKDTSLADPYPTQSADVGAKADSAASSDTGTFSLIALIKRALQNWTTLLARVPALGPAAASGSLPVTLSNENILDQYITGQGSQTALNNNVLLASAGAGALDCQQYRHCSVQITPAAGTVSAGTIAFETSADGVNGWGALYVRDVNSPVGDALTNYTVVAGVTRKFTFPVFERYIRARISVGITGTTTGVQATTLLRMQPLPNPQSFGLVASPFASYFNCTATLAQLPASASPADSMTPTTSQLGALGALFNGSNWDRARGNINSSTGDVGAKTATFNGATQTNYNAAGALITLVVSAVSGTSPTCSVQLQVSYDGTNFDNFGPASTALTAAGRVSILVYPTNASQTAGATPANLTSGATVFMAINAPLPRTWRLQYTIGGTTPSFTFTNAYAAYIL